MPKSQPLKLVRVMLVEDSIPVRARIASLVLESGSAEVTAETGSIAAAISILRMIEVDAVVLDLHLLDGDGCSVLAEIKRTRPDCVVIVLTSFSEAADRLRCIELGADHFFDKTREFERVPEVLTSLRDALAQPITPTDGAGPQRRPA